MKRALISLLTGLAARLQAGRATKGSAGIEPGAGVKFRVAGPVEAPDWLPEHQKTFCAFLATDAGKTLLQRGAGAHANVAIRACQDSLSTTHSAARAAGFGDCLEWLLSLSRTSRVIEEAGSASAEQADDRQQYDTPAIGESRLREHMSP